MLSVVSVLSNSISSTSTMAIEGGVPACSQDPRVTAIGHHPSRPEPVVVPGSVYPSRPAQLPPAPQPAVLDHAHQLLFSEFPSSTSNGEQPSGQSTFQVNAQLSHNGAPGQPARRRVGPNRSVAVPGDFIMYQANDRGRQTSQDGLMSQQATTAYSTHWVVPMAMRSSSDAWVRPSAWPESTQDSWSSTSIDYEHTPTAYNGRVGGHRRSLTQPTHDTTLPSTEVSLEIVIEDPTNPQSYRVRKVRSKLYLAKQKEGIRQLREFGGACVWCYRSKKKCEPTHPCTSCDTNHRTCIRNSEQLCLLPPVVSSRNDPCSVMTGPFSHEALDTLHQLGAKAFQNAAKLCVVFQVRHSNGETYQTWDMDLTSTDLDLPTTTQDVVDQFVAKALMCVDCTQLTQLEETYSTHPLVETALKMSLLFMVMSCLAKTRIQVGPSEVDAGRLTVFLLLVVCSRKLVAMSQSFSAELCEMLRRKDLQDRCTNGNHGLRTKDALDPLWVASALYFRVLCGLWDLETTSPIAKIFGPVEEHWVGVDSCLWSILKCVSIGHGRSSKSATKQTLKDHIPALSPCNYFDLAFWLGPVDDAEALPQPATLKPHSDPFAGPCYQMEPFLEGHLAQSTSLPHAPQPVKAEPSVTQEQQPVQRNGQDDPSISEDTKTSLADPDMLNDIFDPFQPGAWEMMGSIESVYEELDKSFSDESQ